MQDNLFELIHDEVMTTEQLAVLFKQMLIAKYNQLATHIYEDELQARRLALKHDKVVVPIGRFFHVD